jgi:hypothetical protein
MTDNMPETFGDDAQLRALMKVIDQITQNKMPVIPSPADVETPKVTEFVTNKNIRNLQNWCNEYAFEDGDLVGELKSAIIEFQYLLIVIKDLREKLGEQNLEIERLREYKDYLATENRRLERLASQS